MGMDALHLSIRLLLTPLDRYLLLSTFHLKILKNLKVVQLLSFSPLACCSRDQHNRGDLMDGFISHARNSFSKVEVINYSYCTMCTHFGIPPVYHSYANVIQH